MASAADPRLANAPGFGLCRKCPYRETAPASLCFACARQTFEGLAPKRCTVCDLQFEAGETACRNPTCARSDRKFGWNYAVAMRSGVLEEAINDYKYRGVRAWATIFGRVLAGFLEEQARTFRQFHIITASPTFVGDGGRPFNHTRVVLEAAARELSAGSGWPFDLTGDPVIVKTKPTEALVGKPYKQRRTYAETELRAALAVPAPGRTVGKNVLVYDDVFTDGLTLNEVARALRDQGAAKIVCGVTLCRQPWRRRVVEAETVPF